MHDSAPLIGVDARTVYSNSGRGIGNYLFQLVNAMLPQTDYRFKMYYEREPAKKPFPLSEQVQDRRLQIKGSRIFTWEQLALPRSLAKDGVQLLHSTANTMPWWQSCPTVVTVHDILLSHIDDDETPNYLFYWRKIMPRCIAKSKVIITDSEFSRQDMIKTWHTPPEKVRVVPLGRNPFYRRLSPEELATLRPKYPVPDRYIFALGAQAPRKNTLRIVEAFRKLKQETKLECSLVMSGLQPGMHEKLRALLGSDPIAKDIVMLGFIDLEHLRFLYNNAAAFIYASLYEGFGFPLLEGMACGAPVASSNRSSLPEIGGDAALFFDPENVPEMAQCLQQLVEDSTLAQTLRTRGLQQVGQYDWAKAARQTLDVYREVLA
jgi:glycosyltransferase involved in cell wall biosynthesis